MIVDIDKTVEIGGKNQPQQIRYKEQRSRWSSAHRIDYIGKNRDQKCEYNNQSQEWATQSKEADTPEEVK